MMQLIRRLLTGGAKEPRGGQFISFEGDNNVEQQQLEWTKCECNWDALYMVEYSRTVSDAAKNYEKDNNNKKTKTKSSRTVGGGGGEDPTESCTTTNTSSSMSSSDPSNGLAITNRKAPTTRTTKGGRSKGDLLLTMGCGHIVVNHLRSNALPPLKRSKILDELATRHAQAMANNNAANAQQQQQGNGLFGGRGRGRTATAYHSDPNWLYTNLVVASSASEAARVVEDGCLNLKRLGENVIVGKNLAEMKTQMTERASHYSNINDSRYTHMGIGTARNTKTGVLYQCQLFQG